MKIQNFKEKLDFMDTYDIDEIIFMEGEREVALSRYRDTTKFLYGYSLVEGSYELVVAWGRDVFEQLVEDYKIVGEGES